VTYFFDRNFGRNLPSALRLLGLDVQFHAEVFGERTETSDDYWLQHCGRNGLTVIAHDQRFAHNQSELDAIVSHEVGCFILGEANGTRWAKVRLLAQVWDRLVGLESTEDPPFIYRVYRTGEFRRVFPR
jgi:PIN like domain